MGGTLPGGPLACSLSGLASFLCASGSAAGHRGGWSPWKGVLGYNGRQNGETGVGCERCLNQEIGSREPWRRAVMGEVQGGVDAGKLCWGVQPASFKDQSFLCSFRQGAQDLLGLSV